MKRQTAIENGCERCGHSPSLHSHDDERCLSTHPQPCSLPGTLDAQRGAPLAPFRCRECDCPDFVGDPLEGTAND